MPITYPLADETPLTDEQLAELLRRRLTWLPYTAFAATMQILVRSMGYHDVQASERSALHGRTKHGGFDMDARVKRPTGWSRVLIQIKRYEENPISRRYVDELRGTLLRHNAPEGIIISASSISRAARRAADSYPGRPITLIGGSELGELMLRHGLGILRRTDPVAGTPYAVFDEHYFEALEDFGKGLKVLHDSRSVSRRR